MVKYKRIPKVIEAVKWMKNGDHPEDDSFYTDGHTSDHWEREGKIVRYYRHPHFSGDQECAFCGNKMQDHGWIVNENIVNKRVCPGDYVARFIEDENNIGWFSIRGEEIRNEYKEQNGG